ncbi:MAG: Potassium-transporting ATPase KdpC subunit [Chroococcopsis gigantea SAG 12.99]|jgi:K+-transporting ATPase ATPase C chain|nr:K(+)-transporting ATPase subunit C [Chlorogloea purpurea SAG 13.99]MDV2999107.1 Potassium-transporting ATPase KdpC subunit [Chroococcopsis gigantea SAG 12.99]
MSLAREVNRSVRSSLVLWVITALIYPLSMVAIGQTLFPFQANGSIISNSAGQPVGSALIGQPFTSDRYFNARPSTINYSTVDPRKDDANILKTGVSGASNLAPSNPDLIKRIKETNAQLKAAGVGVTPDLLYTSGSGLDPHISPEAAKAQIPRIAKVRKLQANEVEELVKKNTDGRFLGIFGEPGVNVLKLNLDLDRLKTAP